MKYYILALVLTSFVFYSCGTSTGSRYGKKDDKSDKKEEKKEEITPIDEDFDITPYKTTIEVKDTNGGFPEDPFSTTGGDGSDTVGGNNPGELWYGYTPKTDSAEVVLGEKTIEQASGYRILVAVAETVEDADSIKAEVYFKTYKPVYIVFEPPFYKVKAGDFLSQSEAAEFGFKLNQLGYTDSKIIRDTVNVYKQ